MASLLAHHSGREIPSIIFIVRKLVPKLLQEAIVRSGRINTIEVYKKHCRAINLEGSRWNSEAVLPSMIAEPGVSELQSQWQGKRAQRRHDPKTLRTEARVQRAGDKGKHRGGCADADRTIDCLGGTFEPLRHDASDQMHAGEMKQREGDAVQRLH